jgi:AcrR family transcriptional regulator
MLDAAEALLVAEGAGALTTTRVAEAAGVSVGTLNRYLPDKEAIVEALADQKRNASRVRIEAAEGSRRQQLALVGHAERPGFGGARPVLPQSRADRWPSLARSSRSSSQRSSASSLNRR